MWEPFREALKGDALTLLKLKEWVSVDDAAVHLINMTGEPLTNKDIYQLAIEGKATLSVYLPSDVPARIGDAIAASDAKYSKARSLSGDEDIVLLRNGYKLTNDEAVIFEDEIYQISGLWDLLMFAAGEQAIKERLTKLYNAAPQMQIASDGFLLSLPCGKYASLLEGHKGMEYPAIQLPSDALIVIRTREVERIANVISPKVTKANEGEGGGLRSRERNSMLRIIRSLSEMAQLPEKGAAASVERKLEELGFTSPKEDTIRNVLREARELEPD